KIATPSYMAEQEKKIAKENSLKIKIIEKNEMQNLGMNGILAVGSGSKNEPKLVVMEYRTNSSATIALVGKGVCFDSGGYDIKGASSMETMKMDKAGAIAVMLAMEAIAKLKPNVNVVGVMPFVENLVSDTSYKPGDIVKTMSGKTIEILNTDAEGRVILSDALHYAAAEYKPDALIDLATLTGAVSVALGNNVAGIMGNDKGLISKLIVVGSKIHERLWELPMFEDYNELMKSDFADIKNVVSNQSGNPAGTITGAMFLQNFVGDTKWAHLDIAGTAWSNEEKAYYSKGATGFGVRLLAQFIMRP
ncbi:MAG: leucyl aminopeptidase, partial [Candidatus Aenigmarchaeota archaeon]|nr:leucyl aminopeptidase [Candidatus Aenigmarchaeota archaeon]